MDTNFFFGIGLVATLIACAWGGYRLADLAFSRGVYTTENAIELLVAENVEDWNAFRRANAEWRPVLNKVDLSGKYLQDVDLTFSDLRETKFNQANLNGADFSGADIRKASFEGALLRRTVFDDTITGDNNFEGADITGATFANTQKHARRDGSAEHESVPPAPVRLPAVVSDPEQLASLSPEKFTEYVAKVFESLGYRTEMQHGPGSAFDFIMYRDSPLGTVMEIVEAKRFTNVATRVSVNGVRVLDEIRRNVSAQNATFVTNGQFSLEARAFEATNSNVRLVDGARLVDLAKQALQPD